MIKLRILFLLLAIGITSITTAQYIANPGFETYSTCPTGLSQTAKAVPWIQPGGGSSDFYNCTYYGNTSIHGTPYNSSNGVIGQWCYPGFNTSCPSQAYIEYVDAPLDSALVANQTYCGSVAVMIDGIGTVTSPPNNCLDFGVYIYDSGNPPVFNSYCSATNIAPQLLITMDTLLQGTYQVFTYSFVATGGEDRVLVGAFDNANTNGCTNVNRMYANMDSLSLTVCSNSVTANFSPSNFCEGDSTCFTNNTTGSYDTLIWTFGDPTTGNADTSNLINPCHLYSDSGDFTVTLIAGDTVNNVWDTITQVITINPLPIALLANDTSFCSGDLPFTIGEDNEGYAYLWNTGDTTQSIIVDTAGQYFVEVDNNGCLAYDTINVGIIQYDITLIDDTTLCEGEILPLDAGYAEQYLWNTSEVTQQIIVDLPGEYYVTGVDSNNCPASDTVNVNYSVLQLELGDDQYKCSDDKVALNAGTSGATYSWSNGETTQVVNIATPDKYYVTITDGGRCEKVDSVNVIKAETPFVQIESEPGLCKELILEMTEKEGLTYLWNTGETTNQIAVIKSGTYWLEVNNGQCPNSDTISVEVEYVEPETVIPNVFTPNADGSNDELIFKTPLTDTYDLKVYNRWGRLMFESTDPSNNWNGTDAPEGVYEFILVYKKLCGNQETVTETGYITLLR